MSSIVSSCPYCGTKDPLIKYNCRTKAYHCAACEGIIERTEDEEKASERTLAIEKALAEAERLSRVNRYKDATDEICEVLERYDIYDDMRVLSEVVRCATENYTNTHPNVSYENREIVNDAWRNLHYLGGLTGSMIEYRQKCIDEYRKTNKKEIMTKYLISVITLGAGLVGMILYDTKLLQRSLSKNMVIIPLVILGMMALYSFIFFEIYNDIKAGERDAVTPFELFKDF